MELNDYFTNRDFIDAELSWIESQPFLRKASRLGIDIEPDWWEESETTGYRFLNEKGRAKLRKLILKERHERFKMWVEILGPIAGWLTGIIGALIGLASILKK
jgi:hypothetical protein